ncbi:hypothetical protein P7K49_039642, partial [Saguinus oedipus]
MLAHHPDLCSGDPPGLLVGRNPQSLSGLQGGGRPRWGGLTDPASVPARILVDLLKLNLVPLAVFQMLKSMCAGQRLVSEPQDPAALSAHVEHVRDPRSELGPLSLPQWRRWQAGRGQAWHSSERCGPEWPGLFVGSSPSTCRAHPWALLPGLAASLSRHVQVRWTQSTWS